jgi:hypothetical protein
MSNIYMSGFEWGTLHELSWWDGWGFSSIVDSGQRTGNYVCKLFGAYAGVGVALPGNFSEVYIQFAYFCDGVLNSHPGDLFHWYGNYGDNRIGYLDLSETGQIRLYTSTWNSTLQLETKTLRAVGNIKLRVNTWYVIEIRIRADKEYGILSCRVDGNPDCDFAGPTTIFTPGSVDMIKWYHMSCLLDDIVVNNAEGDYNNSWPGCMKVVLLRPNDDGDHTEWTPSKEGHNYDRVNEVPYDPAEYVHATGVGLRDTYGLQDLPENVGDVMIVRGDAWAYKDSGSLAQNRKLAFSVKPTFSIYDTEDQDLFLSTSLVTGVFDVNPDTGVSWTKEEVNLLQAGIKSST